MYCTKALVGRAALVCCVLLGTSFGCSDGDRAASGPGGGGALDGSTLDGASVTLDGGDTGAGCDGRPAPATLVSGQAFPTKIVSDGTNVYWLTNATGDPASHAVWKIAANGGEPAALVTNLRTPDYLAVDATNAYWVDSASTFPNAPLIATVPLAGGAATPLVAGGVSNQQFVVTGGKVYYFEGSALHTIGTAGGPVTTVQPAAENVFNATTDGTSLYWIDDHQHLLKLPLGSATATTLATLAPPADFLGLSQPISVDATGVYAPANPGGGHDAVLRFPLTGGEPATVAAFDSANNGVPAIASDGVNVYWANNFGGAVMRAPVTGGPAVTLSCEPAKPNGVAVDERNVYWTTANGDVKRLAK